MSWCCLRTNDNSWLSSEGRIIRPRLCHAYKENRRTKLRISSFYCTDIVHNFHHIGYCECKWFCDCKCCVRVKNCPQGTHVIRMQRYSGQELHARLENSSALSRNICVFWWSVTQQTYVGCVLHLWISGFYCTNIVHNVLHVVPYTHYLLHFFFFMV